MVYFSLTTAYSLYLNNTQESTSVFACSPITKTVSDHSKWVSEKLGYVIKTYQNIDELTIAFLVNDVYVARIIEGCTSVSIMILFLAFIIAFSGSIKNTIWFGIVGLLLIYATNIFRIVFMSIATYHYPQLSGALHDIVFPGIIYGMVFILWIVWVKKYAIINKK